MIDYGVRPFLTCLFLLVNCPFFVFLFFFFQAEDGIRDRTVTGVQTCALPISVGAARAAAAAQPLVKVVAVLAKVFVPRATVVGAASTPTGASLIRLPITVAEKQPSSTPAVVLDMMVLLLTVAPLAPRSTP